MHTPLMDALPVLDVNHPVKLAQRMRRAWLLYCVFSAVLAIMALWASGEVARRFATASLEVQARTDADLNAALLRAVLEKQRALPLVLAQDTALGEALATGNGAALDQLNRKLEGLAAGTQAAVIYVIGKDGVAVSASNWREPTSFVGNDYRFREYYQKAISDGKAEHFALGSVSKKPGLYISQRIDRAGGPLGVVVVKLEFDQVEAAWAASSKPTYVTDSRGIVLITSIPSWRFMSIGDIPSDALVAIRESLQFGEAPLRPLPFRKTGELDGGSLVEVVMPGSTGATEFLDLQTVVPTTAWTLQHLVQTAPSFDAAIREGRLLALLGLLPVLAAGALLLRRRHAASMRMSEALQAREELERRVSERTADLSQARDRLQLEITDHRTTGQTLQAVQQDLVQANRLAILGQVAAGVAHEINQPVATIRAYADNARVFLERGQGASAADNMANIAALTERIGTITDELRALSRKGRREAEPTPLRQVIEGAVQLLRSRFAGRMETLDIALPPPDLLVMGMRIRLEQVLINLLQNAFEAIGDGKADGRVEVRFEVIGETVAISVTDNGPGISPEILQNLFTPFNTSKESGLGLGLVISKDIAADYGGRIEVSSSDAGTRFTVHLKKA
ncbi:sensor histidine kinase [Rhizobium sp. PL01]|uniref:sensor histidine kinase n=1 Tax=Rhizobium sp. PL01 TaxID=3085631 RepID=UPI0039930437